MIVSASSTRQPSLRGLHSEGSWQPRRPPARRPGRARRAAAGAACRRLGRAAGAAGWPPRPRRAIRGAGTWWGMGEPRGGSESVGEPEVPGPTSGRRSPGRSAPRTAAEPQRAAPSSAGIPLRGQAWEAFKRASGGPETTASCQPPPPPIRGWGLGGSGRGGGRKLSRGARCWGDSAIGAGPGAPGPNSVFGPARRSAAEKSV